MTFKRAVFLCSGFNGLTQAVWCALGPRFEASILAVGPQWERIAAFEPEVVLAPYLTERIPPELFEAVPCLVLHPGPHGLGGPSSLNWAVLQGREDWAACVFEARKDWDRGPLWAEECFPMQPGSVIQRYRRQLVPLAPRLYRTALERIEQGAPPLERGPFSYQRRLTSDDLPLDWTAPATEVLRVIQAGDSHPGAFGELEGRRFGLFEASLSEAQGRPGELLGFEGSDALVACGTGALRIRRLMPEGDVKLRAARALQGEG